MVISISATHLTKASLSTLADQGIMTALVFAAAALVMITLVGARSTGCCEEMPATTGGVWANFSNFVRSVPLPAPPTRNVGSAEPMPTTHVPLAHGRPAPLALYSLMPHPICISRPPTRPPLCSGKHGAPLTGFVMEYGSESVL